MKREDALINWLQIQVVADARPTDQSALSTAAFFHQLLQEDHLCSELGYKKEDGWYVLSGLSESGPWENRYPVEMVESLLIAIESEPKFNQ